VFDELCTGILRQPLWSRFPETYEDAVYIGKTGAAVIKAYEEDACNNTAVASCMNIILATPSRTGKEK
jgi:hypothetical protein